MIKQACKLLLLAGGITFATTALSNSQVLEEIVVTATKRDSTVMDVAASVTAFSPEVLEEREIGGVDDLNINVPNFYAGEYNGVTFINIRGVGFGQTHGSADPAVGQHIDGIFMPRTSSLRAAYYDLEALEVLRGPQGTLYGRNTTGGSVNLITKKPTEEFEGRVGLLYGDYDRVQISGTVSGPISDQVLGRLSVLYDDRDAYTKNLFPGGKDPDPSEVSSVRGTLTFLPSDVLTISLSVFYEDYEGGQTFDMYTPLATNPATLFPWYNGVLFSTEPHETYNSVDAESTREDLIVGLNVDWALSDNWSLKSITGFTTTEYFQFSSGDGTSAVGNAYTTGTDSDTISQEFNLNGSLMDDRLDLLLGAFYYKDELEWFNGIPLDFLGFGPFTPHLQTTFDQDTTSYAAFVDGTYSITEDWRVYGGIRYTKEEKDVVQGSSVLGCGFGFPLAENKEDWTETSFRAGVQHDLTENSMVYVQYSEGFRSGGFDSSRCFDPFEPEYNDSWEIGYKATLADGRVNFLASAFVYDYTDLQLAQLVGLTLEVSNAEGADVRGLEIETQILVAENFELAVNYAYLDTEYSDHFECDTLLVVGNCPAGIEDVSGNPLNRAPEHSLGIVANYTVRLDNGGEVGIAGQWTWTDDIYYRPFGRSEDAQEAYSIGNLFVTYVPSGDSSLTLKAFVKNIGDEEYVRHISANASTVFARQTGTWGAPRTWGVEALWDF
ncbi:MAG: TonB-dependent receptor [Chloroflexota bacterium]|nr:TonB-dependent receptor [Chloroflexota bacterium]